MDESAPTPKRVKRPNRVRHYRKKAGLSVQELADASGLSARRIYRLEAGDVAMSADWMDLLANALKINPLLLLAGSNPAPNIAQVTQFVASASHCIPLEKRFSVELPFKTDGLVGIQVVDGTLMPRYVKGSVLFYKPSKAVDMAACEGRDCVAQTAAGQVVVRHLAAPGGGPNRFLAVAIADLAARELHLKWAAPILWIAILPPPAPTDP